MSNWACEVIQYGEDYRKFMKEMKDADKIPPDKYGMIVMSKKKKGNRKKKRGRRI